MLRLLKSVPASWDGGLIIRSGRELSELRGLLRGVPAHLIGDHGWEVARQDGRTLTHPLLAHTERRLHQAMRAAEACGWKRHLERRRCSIHLNSLDPSAKVSRLMGELCARLWSPNFETDGPVMCPTETGLELRAGARTPTMAVDEIVRMSPEAPTIIDLGVESPRPADSVVPPARPEIPAHCEIERSGALQIRLSAVQQAIAFIQDWIV